MNYDRYEKGYANMKLVVKEEDYMFAPVETYDKAYTIAETEKASSYMKQTIREKDDYTLAPNRVFNHVETRNKVFGNAEVFKGYSHMRQTEDDMFEQNKFLGEYADVAKGYSNMRLAEDNMLQQNRFLGKYAEVARDYSNMRHNDEDNMFSRNRFLGEYETNNKVFAGSVQNVNGYETNDKVYATAQIVAKIPVSVSQTVSYGPWGGNGGVQFDDGRYTGVREIHLARTGGLVSIKVCYDLNGQAIWGNKNGRNGGLTVEKIRFEYPHEVLTHISGYYGSVILRGPTIIKSITFHTNKKKYGPFGNEQGIPFSSASKDGVIVGFHGRKGWFVDSIGVHVLEGKQSQPRPLSEVVSGSVQGPDPCGQGDLTVGIMKKPAPYGPVGLRAGMVKEPAPYGPVGLPAGMVKEPASCGLGPWGGDGGQPWDDKVFTGIKKIFLTKGEAIYSIQMEYDCNGQSIWSVKHGCGNEGTPHLIQFEYPHEFLTCISGYSGSVAGDECRKVIKSLTFYTNRRRYGPYGEETGTYFTSTKDEGKIIGFHGRASSFLYAIGVHIQPSLSDRVCREPKGCPPQYQFNFYQ